MDQRPSSAISESAPVLRSSARRGTAVAPVSLRVLVLHQHYWPEIAATAQILADICEDLVAAGHEVTVVCGQPSYRNANANLAPAETHNGVKIRRVWSYSPQERSIPKRLLHYGSYFASSFAEAIRGARPDVCLVMSTPPLLLGVSGAALKLLRDVPFVYSVQDLYPDIAVHLGVLPERGLLTSTVEGIARSCYRSAAALIALSSGMAERLEAKGVARDEIAVVPNWADTSSVVPTPRDNPFARQHRLDKDFVVQYSGNLGLSQGLQAVLDAADQLRSLPITFALVGDGNAKASLEAEAKQRKLERVVFLPPQPRANLANLLGACDLGLVTMKRGVGSDLVPSKLYGIMAAARPVLASVEERSEVARVLQEHHCGWVVEPESGAALAAGIRLAFEASAAERQRLGERGRHACSAHFSRRASTKRYEDVLRAAAHGRP